MSRSQADEAGSQFQRGEQLARSGTHAKALPFFAAARAAYLAAGDIAGAARAAGNLGRTHRSCGNLEEALECSREAVALFERSGDRRGLATELLLHGNTLALSRETQAAVDAHMKSYAIADALGDELVVGMNMFRLALLFWTLGRAEEARGFLRYASILYVRTGRNDYELDARKVMAQLYQAGAIQASELHEVLDEFFRTPQTTEHMKALVASYPQTGDPVMLEILDGFTLKATRIRCVAKAVADAVALIRTVMRSPADGAAHHHQRGAGPTMSSANSVESTRHQLRAVLDRVWPIIVAYSQVASAKQQGPPPYPMSALPHPKALIADAILEWLTLLAKPDTARTITANWPHVLSDVGSQETIEALRVQYLFLPFYVPDRDAQIMHQVATGRFDALSPHEVQGSSSIQQGILSERAQHEDDLRRLGYPTSG
jgi:tetratricopeptide (TPR) repeat protein